MHLRSGKQYHTPLEIKIICKEKTLNEMREIHISKLNELFYVINTNRLASDKKALLVCEIYDYIYNIFGEFVALQHIHAYSKLLHHCTFKSPKNGRFISGMATLPCAFQMRKGVKTIVKKIPLLTQQLIEVINRNNRDNILDYDIIKPYLQCIEKLAKVQQLANERV